MKDSECVNFLQWALPHLQMRWAGFRKVRGQVCKRIQRRLQALGLADVHAYRERLAQDPGEWSVVDAFCRISISRFCRDRQVFDALGRLVFPELLALARVRREHRVHCWNVGAAGGEEAYSLVLVWSFAVAPQYPGMDLTVHGSEVDDHQIARAQAACYGRSSLKELPEAWRLEAFAREGDLFRLHAKYREPVLFLRQDLREEAPKREYHLVLCRNLAFTYFDEMLQHAVCRRLAAHTLPGGILVLGSHEKLPPGATGFRPWSRPMGIYRRVPASETG